MTVSSILKLKSQAKGPATVTVAATSTVMEAARMLAEHRIGAVVITGADGRVAGILSERDIVRRIAQSGPDSLSADVQGIMTRNVVTCTADTTIDEVMARMTNGRFRHLPVIDAAERLVGVISIGDVIKKHVEDVEQEATTLREYIATH